MLIASIQPIIRPVSILISEYQWHMIFWKGLRDKPLGMSIRELIDQVTWGEKIYLECGQHQSTGRGPRLSMEEEASWAGTCISSASWLQMQRDQAPHTPVPTLLLYQDGLCSQAVSQSKSFYKLPLPGLLSQWWKKTNIGGDYIGGDDIEGDYLRGTVTNTSAYWSHPLSRKTLILHPP